MSPTKIRFALLAAMFATCLGAFVIGTMQGGPAARLYAQAGAAVEPPALPKMEDANAAKPASSRLRDAVIKAPVGTFVKDMEAGEYGSGRLTWTFEDEKVFGTIEANVMGVEVELRTEAEFAMSRNGTIYGIVTGCELTHLKIVAAGELGDLSEYAKFANLAGPLLNELLTDLPFSYQFRVSGDKLTILNYRALLTGPNPLGKLGGAALGDSMVFLSYFQALGLAIEGTYTAGEAKPGDKPKVKPIIRKPMGKPRQFSS